MSGRVNRLAHNESENAAEDCFNASDFEQHDVSYRTPKPEATGITLFHLLNDFCHFLDSDSLFAIQIAFTHGKFLGDVPNFHALHHFEFEDIVEYPLGAVSERVPFRAQILDGFGEDGRAACGVGVAVIRVERLLDDVELQ